MADKSILTKRVIKETAEIIEAKNSNSALQVVLVPVSLERRQTRNVQVTDFDTKRWVRDVCAGIYKRASGHDTIHLDGNVTYEVFFCPLQEVGPRAKYENGNNPNITCLGEIGGTWYGNVLVMKTVEGKVVSMTQRDARSVNINLAKFTTNYIQKWKENKSGADYNLVKEDKLDFFLELYRTLKQSSLVKTGTLTGARQHLQVHNSELRIYGKTCQH
ncbi:hypothetical protein EV421DRAFT_1739209 [Armillaria borealis]|uniref:Uncharacterized protein n=1 Tax=Armillaria borealis TaxID=47425 RepID=A0AA39IV19_9AGAR|nr:hypothetical protein EV421DRAFT_1745179 [Armillaria borealis]KAK0437245.1 hypothetical protein EV421DRAFT_1739209 [Armillaria borealis]